MARSKKEKQEEKHCANHPDIVATDVCSKCDKDICYNCKVTVGQHIYCSWQCYLKKIFGSFFKGFAKFVKEIFTILFWPFRMLGRISLRSWFEIGIIAALAILFYFQWHLIGEIKQLHSQPDDSAIALIDTTKLEQPPSFKPTEGGMVTKNVISIEGEAESNRVITLSINGQLKQAQIAEKNKFNFENIKLNRGQNRLDVRALSEDGKVDILQSIVMTYATPTSAYLVRDFRRGSLDKKQIAFTFDGGAENNITDEILDILKERDIHCSLFLTGHFIRRYPVSVKRMIAEGHEICNHTWSHPRMTSFEENGRHETLANITADVVQEQLNKTASLFKMITGNTMAPYWRSPYGYHNKEIRTWAAEAGFKHIGWTTGRGWQETLDTLDWVVDKDSKAYHSADEIAEKILTFGKDKKSGLNGAIILMHLGTNRKDDFPYKKLPEILDTLIEQGYEMVTISKMLQEN